MILVLAGTQDGRIIAETLAKKGMNVLATTVTPYGGELINKSVNVRIGPLSKELLASLIKQNQVKTVIDTTHPFAKDISLTAIEVCKTVGVKYIRYERTRDGQEYKNLITVKDFDEAVEVMERYEHIFLTIGSKNLYKFAGLLTKGKKLRARVLPQSAILKKCEELGFLPEHIIAMKGPFTTEMNYHMFKQFGADIIVTKDSGAVGGVLEKLEAASMLNLPVVFIERPQVDYPMIISSVDELIDVL